MFFDSPGDLFRRARQLTRSTDLRSVSSYVVRRTIGLFDIRIAAGTFAFATACVPSARDAPGSHPALDPPIELPAPLNEPAASPPSAAVTIPEEPPTDTSSPGRADLDPTNDFVIGPPSPVPDCDDRLRAAAIEFRRAELPLTKSAHGALSCGSEQVIEYLGSASGIRYNAAPVLTCTMALGLASFERVLQEEARARLGTRVKRAVHAGTYSCRRMARFSHMVSEHSYANAIDLRSLTLDDGRSIAIVKDFGPLEEDPPTDAGRFLRSVAHRAYDERIFSVVLTPRFDALHRDHFHLDMARYRVDGTR